MANSINFDDRMLSMSILGIRVLRWDLRDCNRILWLLQTHQSWGHCAVSCPGSLLSQNKTTWEETAEQPSSEIRVSSLPPKGILPWERLCGRSTRALTSASMLGSNPIGTKNMSTSQLFDFPLGTRLPIQPLSACRERFQGNQFFTTLYLQYNRCKRGHEDIIKLVNCCTNGSA